MFLPRKWRDCLFGLAVICVVTLTSADIEFIDTREYHGKQISCVHSEWLSPTKSCGTLGYARVFTGMVVSAVEISDTDKRLQLIPQEVFLGARGDEVTATVNQACLPPGEPEIQAGDKWLFYLRSDGYLQTTERNKELTLPFDSPSKPLSEAQDDIATLRHLAHLTDSGILTGNVRRIGETYDRLNQAPVPNLKVVAKSVSDGAEYTAFTNWNGHFEFVLPRAPMT